MDLKTISIIGAGLFFIAGCGQQAKFTINGKITGANKDSLVLQEMTDKSLELRSTIITDESGTFNFSDTAANPRIFFIHTNQNEYITLMVMKGDKIILAAEKGKINETLRVSGSRQTGLVMELNMEMMKASGKLDSLSKQYEEKRGGGNDPQVYAWVQGEFMKVLEQQRVYIRAFIEHHASEPASLLALSHQIGGKSVLDGGADFDLFEKVDTRLFKKYPKSILVLNLHNYVAAMRQQMAPVQSQKETTGSGSEAPDISLPDPDGKTQTLSSFRGKIVLLDFWAAWCGPCRRENPNLVEAYAKYHDKGFEIFQVSLDKTKPEWVAAIKKDGLNWIHVSDLKFWSSPVARQYGIESIPANFLLDRQGKVITSNLRGPALEEELAKLFQ